MLVRSLILFLSLHTAGLSVFSQAPGDQPPLSNLRVKWMPVRPGPVSIDSFSLVPGSVLVVGVPPEWYQVDYSRSSLTWLQAPAADSVLLRYRVLPLRARLRHMSFDSVINNLAGPVFVPPARGSAEENFFDFGGLNYSGSFGRGISFGNSQDAVVTSNLNLQLSGFLSDSIEIVAAITDNNIPIQPDGTTQQLNEFDRIFLQFRKKRWALSLGDVDLRQQQSYFLSFYKRMQGIAFETETGQPGKALSRTLASGSIAKGKFTRNIIQPQEGNQGPYRLTGANNELFFIVLANTERVYMDGELLQRGEDQDYVINYNTAEIAFTPRRMITKDKRIQVEFEYSDRNYLNANLYLQQETRFGEKLRLSAGAFSNSDARHSPIHQNLDNAQKRFLDSLGDQVNQAFYPVAPLDSFSVGRVLYEKIDTVYDGGRDSIYVFSTNPETARYNLSFTEVGQGFGNYVPDLNGANGKVFRWVAPVNGVRQGSYEPAVFLVTPKTQQVVSIGADFTPTARTRLATEFAMSRYDINTFSLKDKDNDRGLGLKANFSHRIPLGGSGSKALIAEAGYEWMEQEFRPLERLRNVEFTRDWGLALQTAPTDERITTAALEWRSSATNSLRYQATHYHRGDGFSGLRHSLLQNQEFGGWSVRNHLQYSAMHMREARGHFIRPALRLKKAFPSIKDYELELSYSLEHNAVRKYGSDSLLATSFSFDIVEAAFRSAAGKPNRWGISYFTRGDAYPVGRDLLRSDRSQNLSLFTDLLGSDRHQLRLQTTYRHLRVFRQILPGIAPDNSLLGRAEYRVSAWKGLLAGNLLYEVGAGQEQRRDFAYLEVPAGQGEYTWIDYNNDGVQSLNEFEVALFQDQANYIRIFTPTNSFVKANYNTLNYSLAFDPRILGQSKDVSGIRRLIAKVHFQSALQISQKEIARKLVRFNPFSGPLDDTSLITLNRTLVNTISFNRYSPKWGIDLTNSRSGNKSLLTYGYESRSQEDWTLRGRVGLTKSLQLELTGKKGTSGLATSDVKFSNRNYAIEQESLEPRLSLTRGANFRIIAGYRFSHRENSMGAREEATAHALQTEAKYNILQNTSLQGRLTYNRIQFSTQDPSAGPNSTAGYILLEGLLPGKNFLWNIDLNKRLSRNLEMNIQYEGRKPGTGRVVHVGRASIRALL